MKPKNLIPRMKLLSLLLVLAVLLSLQPAVLAEGTAASPGAGGSAVTAACRTG